MPKKLLDLLTRDLLAARQRVGQKQKTTLGGGLVVQMYVEPNKRVHLALMRFQQYPADLEWLTLLRNWPEQLPEPKPEPERKPWGDWMMLTGSWVPPVPVPTFGQRP